MDEKTKSNTSLTTKGSQNLDPFHDFDKIQQFAMAVANSEMAKAFRKGDSKEVDVADIIGAISIGIEIGIPPMSAIALGKTLNAKSYLSVLKGKSMGIDPITSIDKIHHITSGDKSMMYTSVDIISKTILDTNTTMKFIRDYQATPKYYMIDDNSYVGHHYKVFDNNNEINPLYFLWRVGIGVDEIKKAVDEGKIIIKQGKDFTFVTSIHFVRSDKGVDEIFHLSTQEMIDSNLLNGYHSCKVVQNGDKQTPYYVKGKPNWNDNTPQMLRNRCISIPGRIFVADRLQGIYTKDEVIDMGMPIEEAQEAVIVE